MYSRPSFLSSAGIAALAGFVLSSQALASPERHFSNTDYQPPAAQLKPAAMAGNTAVIHTVRSASYSQKLKLTPVAKAASRQSTDKAVRSANATSTGSSDRRDSHQNSAKPADSRLQKTAATTEQATALPAETPAVAVEEKPEPIEVAPTLVVTVNLSKQRMHVSVNGKAAHTWRISSGRGRYRTPNGSFKPTWMSRMHYSKQWGGAPMPHSVFFHNGYAVHATYATRALGRPASHGCVRLSPSNAKKFFYLVRRHGKLATKIDVVGKTPYIAPRRRARVASWKKRASPRRRTYRKRRKKKAFWPFSL